MTSGALCNDGLIPTNRYSPYSFYMNMQVELSQLSAFIPGKAGEREGEGRRLSMLSQESDRELERALEQLKLRQLRSANIQFSQDQVRALLDVDGMEEKKQVEEEDAAEGEGQEKEAREAGEILLSQWEDNNAVRYKQKVRALHVDVEKEVTEVY